MNPQSAINILIFLGIVSFVLGLGLYLAIIYGMPAQDTFNQSIVAFK